MQTIKVTRGTARAKRRLVALETFQGKHFRVYWNGGRPDAASLERARRLQDSQT